MNLFIVRKTAAEFTAENPVLPENHLAAETDFEGTTRVDTGKVKLGDGVRHYADLPYFNQSAPYDLSRQITGKPASSALVLHFVAVRAFTLAATGHAAVAVEAATAQTTFTIAVNGGTVGELVFAAAGNTATVVGGVQTPVEAGDTVTITSPSQDATLEDITFTLFGTVASET
jgi:hypothetical protein